MKNIIKIEAILKTPNSPTCINYKRRVAAYARVSTSSDEQLNSIKAQKDYYPKYIASHPNWEYLELYADEGLSGTSNKKRDEFNRMISDALNGKIDLIVTKSISRFARNTVDTLITIRKLKEVGVEVFFEKEQLFSFDSKGEFMLTLLSSIAQEESRSISENVTWGHRKRFADGKYSLPYGRFLGYINGPDGKPKIVKDEADVVRKIYRLYLEGRTPSNIVALLENDRILSPGGKEKWQVKTIISILSNEKYYGAALLQKSFTVDFLTKKTRLNNGHLPQYFIEDDHEPIISRSAFGNVQKRLSQTENDNSSRYPFSNKIFCEGCGCVYGRKIDGSYANLKKYRKAVWRCNRRFSDKSSQHAQLLNEEAILYAFHLAILEIWDSQPELSFYSQKIFASIIHSDKNRGNKSIRLRSINNFLVTFNKVHPLSLDFNESAWRVIVKNVSATLHNTLVLNFIDGRQFECPILRTREYNKMKADLSD